MSDPILTVIIPAYNEVATIARLLDAVVAAPYAKQIVLVDDGSTDGTVDAVEGWGLRSEWPIEVVRHPVNRGKGAAIRSGLARARCDVTIVQDADLEYDPAEYSRLIEPILHGEADVVYGSRYLRPMGPLPWGPNRICVLLLNLMVRILYGRVLTDEATCYKAFRTELVRPMDLRCERFEFCPEVTAKLCRMGVRIHEVPITYTPRSQIEGKKIRWRDGVEAVVTLLRWRLAPFRPRWDADPGLLAPVPDLMPSTEGAIATTPGRGPCAAEFPSSNF
jgi:dolichol-phosphate mannosyltransferase